MYTTLSRIYPFFFFLPQSCVLIHPHSFPTRRSSDLAAAEGLRAARPGDLAAPEGVRLAAAARADHGRRDAPKSEEHTSELQSRPHLVCRLLLEKKKNNKSSIIVSYNRQKLYKRTRRT